MTRAETAECSLISKSVSTLHYGVCIACTYTQMRLVSDSLSCIIIITRLMTHVKVIHRVNNRKCVFCIVVHSVALAAEPPWQLPLHSITLAYVNITECRKEKIRAGNGTVWDRTVCHAGTSLVDSKPYCYSEKHHTSMSQGQYGLQCT